MIIILDLDHTLFDSAAFKRDMSGCFSVSREVFNSTLQKYFKDKGLNYNPFTHLEFLIKDGYLEEKSEPQATASLGALINQVDDYFIPGAREALDFFRKKGFELVLITHGDKYWQGFKLKQLKINRYFSKCIITEGDKIRELGFLKGAKGEVVFINDDPEELYHMGRAFPEARTFLVYGPYSEKVKDKKVYQISDLPEILCK